MKNNTGIFKKAILIIFVLITFILISINIKINKENIITKANEIEEKDKVETHTTTKTNSKTDVEKEVVEPEESKIAPKNTKAPENTEAPEKDVEVPEYIPPIKEGAELVEINKRIRLNTGPNHTVFIKDDDSLWGFGSTYDGVLGVEYSSKIVSTPIKIMDDVYSAVASGSGTLIIKNDGTLWGLGSNEYGRLGLSEDIEKTFIPIKIMDDVAYVQSKGYSAMVIKKDNSLWCIGTGLSSLLGFISENNEILHTKNNDDVLFYPIKLMDDIAFTGGRSSHTMIIRKDGMLLGWGSRYYGALGDGYPLVSIIGLDNDGEIIKEHERKVSYYPKKILEDIKFVSVGYYHTMAINKDDVLFGWGADGSGDVRYDWGTDSKGRRITYPNITSTTFIASKPVEMMEEVAFVDCGFALTVAIKKDGSLWTWGRNSSGQLGIGESDERSSGPTKIMDDVLLASVNDSHTVVIKKDGSLWVWGRNEYNRLGIEGRETVYNPTKVFDNVLCVE